MVKKKDTSNTIRVNLRSGENYLNYLKLETALTVKGVDVGEFFGEIIGNAVKQYWAKGYENLCSGLFLIDQAGLRFGVKLTRLKLMTLRNSIWVEGEDFYSAPSGETKIFRYDLEKCLMKLKAHILPHSIPGCEKRLDSEWGKFENVHEFGVERKKGR